MWHYQKNKMNCNIKKILKILVAILFSISANLSLLSESPVIFEEAGTYPVVLKDEYGNETRIIYVTVLYPRTIKNDAVSEAIDAYDINVKKDIFNTLSDNELIQLTNARAWNTKTGNAVAITKVDKKIVDAENGWYQVTFATSSQTATTINVLETETEALLINEEKSYVNFFEFSKIYERFFLFFLVVIFPILILLILYFITKNRVKNIESILYQKK